MANEEKTERKKPDRACKACGGELAAVVTLTRVLPITATGASVKVAGSSISQIDLRDSFIKDAGGNEKTFRGPLHCMVCGEEHYFHVGKKTTVCLGSHIDALVHQGAV